MCRCLSRPAKLAHFCTFLLLAIVNGSTALAWSPPDLRPLDYDNANLILTDKLPLAEVDRFYSATLEAAEELADHRWSVVGRLPPGLRLDRFTGELSGTPTAAGSYSIELEVIDSFGISESRVYDFYVLEWNKERPTGEPRSNPESTTQLRTDSIETLASPATFSVGEEGPDLSALLDILEETEEGNWVRVNTNYFDDVWAPPELQPLNGVAPSSPRSIIAAWSSFAWDSKRGDLLLYGGGHANSSGNDVYRWRGTTLEWERASLPSEIRGIGSGVATAIDGAYAAPSSAHTYDNNIYLPIADRFLTFGGAGYNHGGAYFREGTSSLRLTGPYLFDPATADPNKVGGTTGSHVQRVAPYPAVIGGEMWENRDAPSYFSGSDYFPSDFINGATGYAEIDGKDVVYVSARSSQTAIALYRYVLNDINDPSGDEWAKVGRYWNGAAGQGAGAYHPGLNIFVRTSDRKFLYWDLDRAGVNNDDVVFEPEDTSGEFNLSQLLYYGLDYDPVGEQFYLWGGGGEVWILEPPDMVSPEGWTLVKQPEPTSSTPYAGYGTGILGKWKYIPNLDAFMGLQDIYQGNIWLYKPIGWVRPGTDLTDSDGDGMPDAWESLYGLNPYDPSDADLDLDGDGLTNLEEYLLGTDPTIPDSVTAEVSIDSPTEGDEIVIGTEVTVDVSMSGDVNATVTAVEFYADGVLVGEDTTAPYQFTWSSDVEGVHALSARAIDPVDGNADSGAVNVVIVPPPPGGDVVLQNGVDGYAGTQDSYLSRWHTSTNFGSKAELEQQTGVYEDLVRFAVFEAEGGPVPAGAEIVSAELSLYKYSYYDYDYGLRRVLKNWNESQVSWNRASTAEAWSGGGASGVGTDIAETLDARSDAGWNPGWLTFNVTAALQAMSDGDSSNFGWKLVGLGGNNNLKSFRSSEYSSDVSLRPRLVISYLNADPVDTASIELTSPIEDAEFTEGSSVPLAATVADDDNGTVTGVSFYVDGALIGEVGTAPYQMTWADATPGSHAVTAVAVDPVDGDITSAAVNIEIVPPIPPTVVITNPLQGASFTEGAAITLEASLGDDPNGSVTSIAFYADGLLLGEAASTPYRLTWTDAAIGTHVLTAVAVDPVDGNGASSGVTIEVLPAPPPTVTVTSPADGAIVVAGATVPVSASVAGDANGTVTGVAFYADGVFIGEDSSAPYRVDWTTVPEGSHELTAEVMDPVDGNSISSVVNVVAEAAPPLSIDLTSPFDGSEFLANEDIVVAASVNGDTNATVTAVEFYADGVLVGEDTTAPYQFTWSSDVEGVHALSARAIDPVDGDTISDPVAVQILDFSAGGSIVLQNGVAGYAGTIDSDISSWNPAANAGNSSSLREQTGTYVDLIRFKVFEDEGGTIPRGAVIDSAVLSFYKYSYYDHRYGLRRILREWKENEVTWLQPASGEAWTVSGARGTGSDVALDLDATANTGWLPEWLSFDVTAAVQAMADGESNFGWKMESLGGNNNLKLFYSSEYGSMPALRPKLEITFRASP